MTVTGLGPVTPPFDDKFVDDLLRMSESQQFEVKRVAGEKLTRALETVVAFANTDGGFLVLGIEDEKKAHGTRQSLRCARERRGRG